MLAAAILLISGVFVLAAMAGLADALVCFVCWAAGRVCERKTAIEEPQPPTQGITA